MIEGEGKAKIEMRDKNSNIGLDFIGVPSVDLEWDRK
jgi:hypothetical protein